MISVACVLVRGNVPFTEEYVQRLRSMIDRALVDVRHRFVCLTDEPDRVSGIPRVEVVKIPPTRGLPGWWSKIHVFSPWIFPAGEKVTYVDLDVAAITMLPDHDSSGRLSLIEHEGDWKGRNGLKVIPRYNSSVVSFVSTERSHSLFRKWTPDVASRLWGDQDWIAENLPEERTFARESFPRISRVAEWVKSSGVRDISRETLFECLGAWTVLCKKPKNHEAAKTWPWFDKLWR